MVGQIAINSITCAVASRQYHHKRRARDKGWRQEEGSRSFEVLLVRWGAQAHDCPMRSKLTALVKAHEEQREEIQLDSS